MWETANKFWSSRNAFRASTVAKQAGKSSSIVTPSGRFTVPSLEGQESRWQARMQRGHSILKFEGAATMRVAVDGATPLVRRLLAKIAPALTEAFDRELGNVANAALRDWPVSSGYSKSGIFLGFRTVGDFEFVGTIGNAAPYVPFIKGSPWNKLIRQPAKAAASNIAASLRIGE